MGTVSPLLWQRPFPHECQAPAPTGRGHVFHHTSGLRIAGRNGQKEIWSLSYAARRACKHGIVRERLHLASLMPTWS
eukprot:3291733-Karenia_brevis.AAC.1